LTEGYRRLVDDLKSDLGIPSGREESEVPQSQVPRQEALVAGKRLMELLSNGESEAIDFLANSGPVLASLLEPDHFQKLKKAIKEYNFNRALQILREKAIDLETD
jgi:hypothetical protein